MAVISNAQQTISTSGGDAKGSGGSSSFIIGQKAYINYYNVNGFVNQGVLQPFEFYCSSVAGKIVAPSAINIFNKTEPNVWVNSAGGNRSLFAN